MAGFKVGSTQVDCTPRPGLPFMGHFRQDYAAKGTHDPLMARAMVIADDHGNKCALLTIDVCMLTRGQVANLRTIVSQKCNVEPENILVAATHTHGSIATASIYMMPATPQEDINIFIERAAQAVINADKRLKTSVLKIGTAAEERLSFNRRLKCRDGSMHMNWEEIDPAQVVEVLGPIDPQLLTIAQHIEDRVESIMVNFALHPAILDYENDRYTADYIGYLTQGLRQFYGEDCISMFFNGCCGNINHLNYADKDSPRRGFVMAQRVGYMLAAGAAETIRKAKPINGDLVRVSREFVELERFRISDELYQRAKQFLASGAQENFEQIDGLDVRTSAPLWVEMYERQEVPDAVEVMAIRIGDTAIVGLPGEVFCELGLAIKRQSPAAHTLIIELANDSIGYLPVRDAFAQGGYEVTPGATNYQPGAGEKLVQSALKQLETLFTN